jgi:hypothetical protein
MQFLKQAEAPKALPLSNGVNMKTDGNLLAELMHQRDLLSDLISELEVRRTLTVKDYAYCESCTDEVSKKLKDVRRFALDKMIQGVPWFQGVIG